MTTGQCPVSCARRAVARCQGRFTAITRSSDSAIPATTRAVQITHARATPCLSLSAASADMRPIDYRPAAGDFTGFRGCGSVAVRLVLLVFGFLALVLDGVDGVAEERRVRRPRITL